MVKPRTGTNAYKLPQLVGNWFEFMETVEKKTFGVSDFHQELQVNLFPFERLTIFDGITNTSVRIAG
jgi:hypothetical protein